MNIYSVVNICKPAFDKDGLRETVIYWPTVLLNTFYQRGSSLSADPGQDTEDRREKKEETAGWEEKLELPSQP